MVTTRHQQAALQPQDPQQQQGGPPPPSPQQQLSPSKQQHRPARARSRSPFSQPAKRQDPQPAPHTGQLEAGTAAADAPAANGVHFSAFRSSGSGKHPAGHPHAVLSELDSTGVVHPGNAPHEAPQGDVSRLEWANLALLVLLYAMQGIPLGLTMGALPFMLQSKVSLTQMGIFSMAAYPYSFKLLWSPIVDSTRWRGAGLRKSWIVPCQLASAALLLSRGAWMQARYEEGDVVSLTVLFFVFVLLAATQDIAVDGWALTLLPPAHVEYASTCQTLGMNVGYFTSFTLFLAFSNPDFCNKYIRAMPALAGWDLGPPDRGVISLQGYVTFWGWAFTAVTLAVAWFKTEGDPPRLTPSPSQAALGAKGSASSLKQGDGSSKEVVVVEGEGEEGTWASLAAAYKALWGVVNLRAIWALSALLVTYRLGVLPSESTAALKLLDKGVAKESLAALVLAQFPVDLVSAVVAGRWASNHAPYAPFMAGYFVRLACGVATTTLAAAFPEGAASFTEYAPWWVALVGVGLVTSFTSTLMFTALGSFFNRISDPAMGGAYLTLLNTIANMGVILPKTPLFALMDALTISTCRTPAGALVPTLACPKKLRELAGPNECTAAGGVCSIDQDGFYIVSYSAAAAGLLIGLWILRLFPRLDALPANRWRARQDAPAHSKQE